MTNAKQAQALYILTGASRGLGAALAELIAGRADSVLLGLSRGRHAGLEAMARAAGSRCEQWPVDLAEPAEAAERLAAWLSAEDGSCYASATLINNAALLPRIAPLAASDAIELARSLRVGLEAPLLLASAFLRATAGWTSTQRRLLNISSGLGRRAMASQAAYCAVKAGLDHATRCIALEGGVQAVSLAPGVIDTDMQAHLRASDPAAFPDHALFVGMQRQGQLDSPAANAAKLFAYLQRPNFGSQPVADLREA